MEEADRPDFTIPTRLDDLGVPAWLVEDLFARRLMIQRTSTIGEISSLICVARTVGQEVAESLREKNLLEYRGAEGRDYRIAMTETGERRIGDLMRGSAYVVPVPVSIEDYRYVVENQTNNMPLDQETVNAHLSDMVVPADLADQLGPAFLSNGAIFLYGPPGTGKTSLAERLGRFANDSVLIPKVIEADGQLIPLYDPAIHTPTEEQPAGLDPRWMVCQRPVITVGGELQLDSLDLSHDPISGLHGAPLQMQANNGLLLVDDFGRQTASPDQILNRWILPLSHGVDFLRGRNGGKFTVPFRLKLVLATNLNPTDLGDEAFLRRMQNKIYVGGMNEKDFRWTLARAAQTFEVELTTEGATAIVDRCMKRLGELRPYIARDFCHMALSICEYYKIDRVMTPDVVERIAETYFVKVGADNPYQQATERAAANTELNEELEALDDAPRSADGKAADSPGDAAVTGSPVVKNADEALEDDEFDEEYDDDLKDEYEEYEEYEDFDDDDQEVETSEKLAAAASSPSPGGNKK